MKNKIRETLYECDYYEFPNKVGEVIDLLSKYPRDADFDIELSSFYDDPIGEISISKYRLETDEEFKNRIEKENDKLKRKEESEYNYYLKLKERFGEENVKLFTEPLGQHRADIL